MEDITRELECMDARLFLAKGVYEFSNVQDLIENYRQVSNRVEKAFERPLNYGFLGEARIESTEIRTDDLSKRCDFDIVDPTGSIRGFFRYGKQSLYVGNRSIPTLRKILSSNGMRRFELYFLPFEQSGEYLLKIISAEEEDKGSREDRTIIIPAPSGDFIPEPVLV